MEDDKSDVASVASVVSNTTKKRSSFRSIGKLVSRTFGFSKKKNNKDATIDENDAISVNDMDDLDAKEVSTIISDISDFSKPSNNLNIDSMQTNHDEIELMRSGEIKSSCVEEDIILVTQNRQNESTHHAIDLTEKSSSSENCHSNNSISTNATNNLENDVSILAEDVSQNVVDLQIDVPIDSFRSGINISATINVVDSVKDVTYNNCQESISPSNNFISISKSMIANDMAASYDYRHEQSANNNDALQTMNDNNNNDDLTAMNNNDNDNNNDNENNTKEMDKNVLLKILQNTEISESQLQFNDVKSMDTSFPCPTRICESDIITNMASSENPPQLQIADNLNQEVNDKSTDCNQNKNQSVDYFHKHEEEETKSIDIVNNLSSPTKKDVNGMTTFDIDKGVQAVVSARDGDNLDSQYLRDSLLSLKVRL
jgi:hypothetical protein